MNIFSKYKSILLVLIFLIIVGCEEDNEIKQSSQKLTTWHYLGVDSNWHKTYMPGSIQFALQRDTLFKNLFFGTEFTKNYWTDTVAWEFKTSITIPKEIKKENYDLVFNGIVGIADVYLNDSLLFRADNMFRVWKYDVTELLKKGKNSLVVKFLSIDESKKYLNSNSSIDLPFSGQEMMRLAYYYTDTLNGIPYIPTGFWKAVSVVKWDKATVENVYFELTELKYDEYATIKANYTIRSDNDVQSRIIIKNKKTLLADEQVKIKKGINVYSIEFKLPKPHLWWTYDLGTPFLYNFKTIFSIGERVIYEKESSFGVREITIDTTDHNFVLKLNGVPIVLKIIDYVPLNIFQEEISEDNYTNAVSDFVEANINMVHILEEGIYERGFLYNECDKKGVLVWQDFMLPYKIFDNSEKFYENVEKEIVDVLKSLRNHPSVAFYSGQNFIKKYWNKYSAKMNYSSSDSILIFKSNKKVFGETIPKIVKEYSKHTPYFEKMDFHSIVYLKDDLPSYPHIITIRKFTKQNERKIDGNVIKNHQKPYNSLKLIDKDISKQITVPQDITGFLYANQIFSKLEYKSKIEKFRFEDKFNGFISGRYNDFSPVISNSAVDFNGFWKGKMYGIKDAYSKLQVKITDKNGWVYIKMKSDFLDNVNVDFYFKLYDFNGDVLWRKNYLGTNLVANETREYFDFNLGNELARAGRNFSVFKIDAYIDNELYSEEYHFFSSIGNLKLKEPNIKMKYFKVEEGYVIELTTDYLAKSVYLYTEKSGRLSDNFVDIIPGETKKITFYTNEEIYAIEGVFKTIDFSERYNHNLFRLK